MTEAEFKRFTGYNPSLREGDSFDEVVEDGLEDISVNAPSEVDWKQKGAVTPIKNQGSCGSCWAFSTTGAMEGAYKITHGSLINFSEQQLVDCSTKNNGCNGGLMDLAFQYLETHKLERENDYPYTGRDGSCKYKEASGVARATGYVDVKHNSPSALVDALSLGPVSVAIEADTKVFQSYSEGII